MKAFFVICFGWNSEGFISALGCGSSFPWHFTQFHVIIRPDGFLSFWNMNTEFRKPCVTAVTSNHIVIVFWHVHGNSSTKGLEFLIVPILTTVCCFLQLEFFRNNVICFASMHSFRWPSILSSHSQLLYILYIHMYVMNVSILK